MPSDLPGHLEPFLPNSGVQGSLLALAGRLEGLVPGLREGRDGVLVDGLGPEEHLEDVAAANLAKLSSRAARGRISGSGDKR